MRLNCACEQTGAQGNDRTYSGTRNSLSVKMRARTLGFVFSQVYHGRSRHSVGLFWFSTDRDMWGERDDSICGQKIHILPTGLKSKRWRQLRRNERPGNSEFVSSYVWGEKTSNVPLMTVEVKLVLDFILLIQYLICYIICLLNIASIHLNVTFSQSPR